MENEDRSKLLAIVLWRIANPDVVIDENFEDVSAIEAFMEADNVSSATVDNLNYVYNIVGVPMGTREKLLREGVHTLNGLVQLKSKIEIDSYDLNVWDKSKLLAVIKWRISNPDANIKRDFDESSISTDMEWDHICIIANIPYSSREKLEKVGVCSLDALLEFQPKLEGRPDYDTWDEDQWIRIKDELLTVIEWRRQNKDVDVLQNFNAEARDAMLKRQRIVTSYIELALGQPFKERNKQLFDIIEKEDLLGAVVKKCQESIMSSVNLRKQCGKFDYNLFIDQAVRHLHFLNGDPTDDGIKAIEKLIVIAGRTQSGKSAIKGVIQSLAGMVKLPLIVLTKNVDESIDLHVKLQDLSTGWYLFIPYCCAY